MPQRRRPVPYVVIDRIRDSTGKVVGYAKITRDLTERRKAEEELRASEEQFRLLVEGVTDYALCMLSPKGNVSSWNAEAQRIKGCTPEEIIGSHFSQFYTEPDGRRKHERCPGHCCCELHGKFLLCECPSRCRRNTFQVHKSLPRMHDCEVVPMRAVAIRWGRTKTEKRPQKLRALWRVNRK